MSNFGKSTYVDYKSIMNEQKKIMNYLENRFVSRKNPPVQDIPKQGETGQEKQFNAMIQTNPKSQEVEESAPGIQGDLFSKAIALYKTGLDGDSESVKKSYAILKELNEKKPENTLIEAYYGCLTTLLGRDELDPNQRFKWVMKGLKILDKAVGSKSEDVEIRSLRARVCLRLPEMYFHRNSTAVEDFAYLASRYEKDKSIFPEEEYHQVLFDLGEAYKGINKLADAQKTWDKLLSSTKDPRYTELVKRAGGRVKTVILTEDTKEIVHNFAPSTPSYTINTQKKKP